MEYAQHTRIVGTGYNFKMGAIANPVGGLRVGLAFHSPTWTTINKQYSGDMHTRFAGNTYGEGTALYEYEYDYNTHGRVMAGISYVFGSRGLVSLDYECDFYDWMRIRVPNSARYYYVDGEMYDEFAELKASVKDTYKSRHVVRFGGEFKPTEAIALRGGVAYHGSFLEDNDVVLNEPLPYKSLNLSAGAGYRFSNKLSLDVAYVYMKTDYSPYETFYYDGLGNSVDSTITLDYGVQNAIRSSITRHNIVASLSMRF
jgi:long-subunit fatty acid transport protein